MSALLTKAQAEALRWFADRGGDGCFAEKNRQVLLARGERAPFMRSTWSELMRRGRVEAYGQHRLRLAPGGAP